MTDTIIKKGYLTKRSNQGGNFWRKRFFVLYSDGRLTCSEKKGAAPKYVYALTPTSKLSSIPKDELKAERGFFITFNSASRDRTAEVLCVKSVKKQEIDQWRKVVKGLLTKMSDNPNSSPLGSVPKFETKSHLNIGGIYQDAKTLKRKGSTQTLVNGYVMKVGKGKDSGDYFVNAHTFEYFKSEDDCLRGAKPLGKATLSLLV